MQGPGMTLHMSHGPNPQVVALFLKAKGATVPTIWIDIAGAENRCEPYLSEVNAAGTTPALVLDDGSRIAQVLAICEYLDERLPDTPLIGTTAEERAQTRMWTRHVDLMICEPMANSYRFGAGLEMFAPRMRCLPEAVEGLKAIAQDGLAWVDAHFPGPWIAGDRFTLADIMLLAFLEFAERIAGQPMPASLLRLSDWRLRARTRLDDIG